MTARRQKRADGRYVVTLNDPTGTRCHQPPLAAGTNTMTRKAISKKMFAQ